MADFSGAVGFCFHTFTVFLYFLVLDETSSSYGTAIIFIAFDSPHLYCNVAAEHFVLLLNHCQRQLQFNGVEGGKGGFLPFFQAVLFSAALTEEQSQGLHVTAAFF